MTECLVPVASYLTYLEATMLYQDLAAKSLIALVKSCGPPTLPYGEGQYFQLLLKETDLAQASIVLEAFSQKQAENKQKAHACPACASECVGPSVKLPFWKKLFYAGTTLFTCQACKQTFFM